MPVSVTCVGIMVVDFIAADLQRVSAPGEVTFTPVGMHIGGHAANVSIDLVKLGLKRGEVSSIGSVGEDLLGTFVEQNLNSFGVVTHLIRTRKADTSKDIILVVRGEDRRFHFDVGANLYLDPEFVKGVLKSEKPLILYVGAVGLLGEFDEKLLEVLKMAKELGCLTFLDPIRPYSKGWDFLVSATPLIDIFHCNNLEAAEITGKEQLRDAVKELANLGVKMAVVSIGDKGLVAAYEGEIYSMPCLLYTSPSPRDS